MTMGFHYHRERLLLVLLKLCHGNLEQRTRIKKLSCFICGSGAKMTGLTAGV